VIWRGRALEDTGTPGIVSGYGAERVLRAPEDGYVIPAVEIGTKVEQGELIGMLNGHAICAPFPGMVRGIIHPSVYVWKGLKLGDLDPRGDLENCYTISDKSLAIGGGVLEAILSAPSIRQNIHKGAWADAVV
jgi:xanthine dehydrogenase accessory factor